MNAHSADLHERGYSVFPDLLDASEVRDAKAAIEELVEEIDPPCFCARPPVVLSDTVLVTSPGLAISRLFDDRPSLRKLVLQPRLIEAMRATLGDDMVLELAGAVVSDSTRPFFTWHTHIDGVDEGERFTRGEWPAVDGVHRVLSLLYLQDLDERTGPFYALPRRAGDPTPPPYDFDEPRWPGMVELRARAGTSVAIDQCTWHAADSLTGPGLRIFVACYFARAGMPPQEWVDTNLMRMPLS